MSHCSHWFPFITLLWVYLCLYFQMINTQVPMKNVITFSVFFFIILDRGLSILLIFKIHLDVLMWGAYAFTINS